PLMVETQAAEVEVTKVTLYLDLDAIHIFDALSENSLASF
nr:sn-glycerol-3-phosphate ABC transporter ATP-binding protein UgpC [Vibrio anguillarum]